jgi:hypothetical protein
MRLPGGKRPILRFHALDMDGITARGAAANLDQLDFTLDIEV